MQSRPLHFAWFSLCSRLGFAAAPTQQLWQVLETHYASPERAYHNLNHISYCLQTIHPHLPLAEDPLAVELALWFHDLIYDPQAHDNEPRSAAYAGELLAAAALPTPQITEVQRLILLTQTHQARPYDRNAHLVLDADLAILGAAAPVYQQYSQAIRQEYHWVDEAAYRQGRGRVLTQFLERPFIYHSPPFFQQLESPARHNLFNELMG
ncbi:MAG: hypothetical protein KJ063_07895 [Anaerolineae bacterium]|nr:hypothetical protein [Anaerolineae bacterium]